MDPAALLARLRTPHKLGRLVLAPSLRRGAFDNHAVDCPFPFRHDGRYLMTYIGWDGIGYRTGLASSDDLLTWRKEGLLIDRGPAGSVMEYNVALTSILRENELFGPSSLRPVDGRYAGTYHAYPRPGYESGPAVIGLCWSDDLRRWELGDPVLRPDPACAWEAGGLYKSWLMEADGTYYLFYNAKTATSPWIEQTGMARSPDLVRWERYPGNPVLQVGAAGAFDDRFASDPCVFRHDGGWVMFYYGLSSDGAARDGAAASDDLLHWEKLDEVLIDVGPPGSIDCRYAHKPGIIHRDGRLQHFYCAVAPAADPHQGQIEPGEVRGISVAWGD
ncbi:MAG: hypothetical protein ABIL09_13155 [Gemmatimonadota bacterium]